MVSKRVACIANEKYLEGTTMICSIIKNPAECANQPADLEQSETRLERMERYANHLEDLIMRKNEEMRLWRRTMALRLDEEIQKAKANEHIMIHRTRQAAMGELLELVSRNWRQPLSIITLIVQNMKEAWEVGEFDGGLLERSISQAMEQIGLLSHSIDDYYSLIKTGNYSFESNMSGNIRAENFADNSRFGVRLPAVSMERCRE